MGGTRQAILRRRDEGKGRWERRRKERKENARLRQRLPGLEALLRLRDGLDAPLGVGGGPFGVEDVEGKLRLGEGKVALKDVKVFLRKKVS
jgi:hypothetical protein